MKVCMLADKPLPSERPTGIGVAAFNMALAVSRQGTEVHYVCRGKSDDTDQVDKHLTVQTVERFTKDNLGASLSLLRKTGFDLIHVHSSSAAPSLVAAWAIGKPAVFHSHGDQPLHPLGLTMIRSVEMKLSKRVVAVSRRTRNDLMKNHHLHSSKVVTVYNGVDVEEFVPTGRRLPLLERLGLEGFDKILLSVGAIQARKGQLRVVECLPEILKTWPKLVYVNVGVPYEEESRRSLLESAKERGVSGALKLIPSLSREDLVSMINAADLCLHPAIQEPFGLAVVEEMACGRTVIAFDVEAIPEIIEDGVDGVLVSPGDRKAMTRAILEALADPESSKRIGDAARLKVVSSFTWERTGAVLAKLYQEILR